MRPAPIGALIVLFLTSLLTFGTCPRAQARLSDPYVRAATSVRSSPSAHTTAGKPRATCPLSSGLSAARMPRTMAHAVERPVALLPLSHPTLAPVFGPVRVPRSDRERILFPGPRGDGEPGRPREP